MAEMALLKAVEAGVDGIDTAISSMSGTYGHPATESLVAPYKVLNMTPVWIFLAWKKICCLFP